MSYHGPLLNRAGPFVIASAPMGSPGRPWSRGLLLVALALAACNTPASPSAKNPETSGKPTDSPDGGASSVPTAEGPSGPRKPSCSDGSCFECGEGICPVGFYCETAGGAAPGCGWSAACAQKPSCACLAPTTKGCTCQDRGGFPHVSCP